MVSQRGPVYPGRQVHTKYRPADIHVALFLQGEVSHQSLSVMVRGITYICIATLGGEGGGVLSLENGTDCGMSATELWLSRAAIAKKEGLSRSYKCPCGAIKSVYWILTVVYDGLTEGAGIPQETGTYEVPARRHTRRTVLTGGGVTPVLVCNGERNNICIATLEGGGGVLSLENGTVV